MGKNFLYAIAAFTAIVGAIVFVKNRNMVSTVSAPSASVTASAREIVRDGKYALAAQSALNWEGRKTLIVGYKDVGTLMAKEGNFTVSGGTVTDGKIVFDMSTIRVGKTGKGMGESGLDRHLKSDDFFGVEKFPTAELVFKETLPSADVVTSFGYTVRGELTIKGITQLVEIPVTVYMQDGKLRVDGKAELDRTKWDIRYGSDKFFDNLANNVIDDMFSVSFQFVAGAQ